MSEDRNSPGSAFKSRITPETVTREMRIDEDGSTVAVIRRGGRIWLHVVQDDGYRTCRRAAVELTTAQAAELA